MISSEEILINHKITDENRLYIETLTRPENCTYAFYIFRQDEKTGEFEPIEKVMYQERPFTVYFLSQPGTYRFRVFIMDKDRNIYTKFSEDFEFKGFDIVLKDDEPQKGFKWLNNVKDVIAEIFENRKRMVRIALYDYSITGKDSYLGKVWNILGPLIQIGAYWFAYGFGIYGGSSAQFDGIPYLAWMLVGLIPWFFMNGAITKGAGSVFSKASMALRLKYPIATIPAGAVLVELFNHLAMMVILFITLFAYKIFPNFYWLNLIYYIGYAYITMTLLALITSTLTMIARDFQLLINSLMRILFFITPIVWKADFSNSQRVSPEIGHLIDTVLNMNPILYVANGFRDSLIYDISFFEHPVKILFFWSLNIILLIVGCNVQKRYKDNFLDLL